MPYITKDRRESLKRSIAHVATVLDSMGNEKGDLNYAITRLVIEHVKRVGMRYASLSDVTGVLNDVKTEFERRVLARYEDLKSIQNGDVYDDVPGATEDSLRESD